MPIHLLKKEIHILLFLYNYFIHFKQKNIGLSHYRTFLQFSLCQNIPSHILMAVNILWNCLTGTSWQGGTLSLLSHWCSYSQTVFWMPMTNLRIEIEIVKMIMISWRVRKPPGKSLLQSFIIKFIFAERQRLLVK